MKQHFRVIWGYDFVVSVIGDDIAANYEVFRAYHGKEMNSDERGYRNYAVHFANWFLVRGFQVHIYTYESDWKDMVVFRFFLGLGKTIGEVLPGIILGEPETKPETTLYV